MKSVNIPHIEIGLMTDVSVIFITLHTIKKYLPD